MARKQELIKINDGLLSISYDKTHTILIDKEVID